MKNLVYLVAGLIIINLVALISELLWSNIITAAITFFSIFTLGFIAIIKGIKE